LHFYSPVGCAWSKGLKNGGKEENTGGLRKGGKGENIEI
jgi:hypothetical protein